MLKMVVWPYLKQRPGRLPSDLVSIQPSIAAVHDQMMRLGAKWLILAAIFATLKGS